MASSTSRVLVSFVTKFYSYHREANNKCLISQPAITTLFSYAYGQEPHCLVKKMYVKAADSGVTVCDLEIDLVALKFDLGSYQPGTKYQVIAQRNDGSDVTPAAFSLMKDDQNLTIFKTFNYLEVEVL